MRFTWDDAKARRNRQKHRVDFEEAKTVFSDSLAKVFHDETHSSDEDRLIIVGSSHRGRLLLVSYIELSSRLIRIISARTATRLERQDYEEIQGF
jgi:uncharacterized protein